MSKELTPEQKQAASKLNVRQLAFANLVLTKPGHKMTDAECYRKAGYKPKTKKQSEHASMRCKGNARVAAYLKVMQEAVTEATGDTVESLVKDLEELRKMARDDGKYSAAVSAVMGKAKILGLEKTVLTGPGGGPVEINATPTLTQKQATEFVRKNDLAT